MAGPSGRLRGAFTLVELLVVIGILAVVLGLTLAAVQRVREMARRAECQNRLKNQGLAVLNYESAHGTLPPGAVQGPFEPAGVPAGVSHGLWPLLLAQLDQVPLARLYRLDLSFDDPANQPVVTARLGVLECPNASPAARTVSWPVGHGAVTDYAPFDVNPFLADVGVIDSTDNFQGPLPVNGSVRLTDITDGTSTTILLAEASGRPGMAWSSPESLLSLRQFFGGAGGLHPGGSHACMADGSVHFLSDRMSLRVLGRLATRAGGEVLSGNEF
jgi:prepilin-type N-terminal cleavage/methylation domain-containing protein/prepilin-type processing-associated H-X9-DG protein